VFGKTGAGKSSLVNAIFGQDVCPVSDVEACTREIQEANVGGIILVDCPGIAESKERDEEYHKLYSDLIPKMDAIIWVLQGDNRSYGPDIEFYELLRECFKTKDGKNAPIYFALNQVDKIEPFREWDVDTCQPGPKQAQNIKAKVENVAAVFKTASNMVIPVSAVERYNLSELIAALLNSLPANQAIIASSQINDKWAEERRKQDERIKELERQNKAAAAALRKKQKEEDKRIQEAEQKKREEYNQNLAQRVGQKLEEVGDFVEKIPVVGDVVGGALKIAGKIIGGIGSWFN
ncbi:MAG: 50S ribosome-binding GTPase, partial [Paludibacteraceae bacterium]|nr:50S ribosome-binding GTPase [Paludibacteraceae bacterium]